MEHFDLPSPGLVIAIFLLVTIVPMAVLTLVPAVLFRAHFRRSRALWASRTLFVVPAAYRGSTMEIDSAARVPSTVVVVSLLSLYVAVPVLVVAPVSLASLVVDGLRRDGVIGFACSLVMVASAIVGCAILRPSREAAVGARVVAAWEIVFAAIAAWVAWTPLAIVAGIHAIALLLAAFVNQRGNVQKCA